MSNRGVYLSREDIGVVLESLKYSVRNVSDWHAQHGTPEFRDRTLEPILRVRDKLREAVR